MAKLNGRQEAMVTAYKAFKNSGRSMVVLLEANMQSYWGEDSRSVDNLAFFVNLIGETPRLQKDVIKLIPQYTGCTVSKEGGVYTLTNSELSKKKKEALKSKLSTLIAAEWPTIQDIDKPVKEEKDKKAVDTAKRFRVASKAAVLDGYTPQQLLNILQEAALEAAQEVEADELAATNEAELMREMEARNEIVALEDHIEAA